MKAAIRTGLTGLTYAFSDSFPLPKWDADGKNADDVYLKVNSAAMNPVDYKIPKALVGPIYGIDCCGTIEKVGTKTQEAGLLQVGDVVIGPVMGAGSMAEYTIANASKVTKLAARLSVEEGAAIPTAYDTAITAFDEAGILEKYKASSEKPPVDSILVIGASGGCGMAALHLAKGMGIPRIIGICSSKNADFCKEQGATEIVPYDDQSAVEAFSGKNEGKLDLIYDTASFSGGGETYSVDSKTFQFLKADQTDKPSYLVLNGPASHWLRRLTLGKPSSDPRMALIMTRHSSEYLAMVLELLEKAKAKPMIDSILDFTSESVEEGYKKLKSRRVKGKVVVKMT